MRTKSRRGGRSRRPRHSAASSPSSMESPSVPDRDVTNAEDSTLNDGFVSGQDVPNAEDNTLNDEFVSGQDVPNAEENTLHEASRKETNDVLDKVDCFQKDTCIRCDESGDLLVCTEIYCPIAIHEYCMSCEPSFDEEGRFYCPYCSYKRALVRVNELRRTAMVAKRALSNFIDTRMVGGGNSPQVAEAGKKRASDVPTRGVDADLPNHGSHLGNDSLRDQEMQVEQNQSNEGENHERTAGYVQSTPTVGVNGENHYVLIESNVSNDVHLSPEVQPCEDSMNEEETRKADTSGTHEVDSLEDKEDGEMMEEENLWSTDDIEDEEVVKDQGQPETPSANHDDEETAIDDVDHGAEPEFQDTVDGGEKIQPEKGGMHENINFASGNNGLKNETVVKKKRFKTKANRRIDLRSFDSPRKSLRLQTSDPGKKSPHIRTPEPGKRLPHIQTPEPGKRLPNIQIPKPGKSHATKIEKVSASRNLKQRSASPNQFKNLDFHGGKRKRLRWSTEEEEILKEGVQRFSSTANKNLPWRKILEFGRHIFDTSRTPVDLKDKWRNILGK